MFAQLNDVPPDFLKWLALAVIALIGGAAGIASIYSSIRRHRVEPQPLLVKGADEHVSKEFCAHLHSETVRRVDEHSRQIELIWEHIVKQKEETEAAARARSAKIYEKIEEVRTELSRDSKRQLEMVSKGFQDLERAIGHLEGKLNSKF
ncbi:MAG TPA: hypothetical protein PKI20_13565 [Verrucomicrobiota bacterium]|jgi:hypothetical protein|nr:hypothetical protein [Verrucomicrobiota bacterium]HQL78699.1 hypothetical protein [Verrucomicrobiota bacterium]